MHNQYYGFEKTIGIRWIMYRILIETIFHEINIITSDQFSQPYDFLFYYPRKAGNSMIRYINILLCLHFGLNLKIFEKELILGNGLLIRQSLSNQRVYSQHRLDLHFFIMYEFLTILFLNNEFCLVLQGQKDCSFIYLNFIYQ